MEKNHILNHSITHPAYLMPREPKLRNLNQRRVKEADSRLKLNAAGYESHLVLAYVECFIRPLKTTVSPLVPPTKKLRDSCGPRDIFTLPFFHDNKSSAASSPLTAAFARLAKSLLIKRKKCEIHRCQDTGISVRTYLRGTARAVSLLKAGRLKQA